MSGCREEGVGVREVGEKGALSIGARTGIGVHQQNFIEAGNGRTGKHKRA
jgi:hypothetical protein